MLPDWWVMIPNCQPIVYSWMANIMDNFDHNHIGPVLRHVR